MPFLEWRETARADLLAIVDYISDDNPDAAPAVSVHFQFDHAEFA